MRQNHAIDNATRVSASIGSDSDRRSNFFVRTHLAELVEALVDEHFSVHAHKFLQSIDDPILHALGSLSVIAMRAAEWFRDHIVHETVLKISLRSECETLRCNRVRALVGFFEEDGCTTFGTDDGVPRMFKHANAIGHCDAKCATRPTLSNHDAHDRRAQTAHLHEIHRDRLRLSALLTANPRIRARRINKCDDGKFQLLGESHLQQCLAISLWLRATKVRRDFLLHRLAFVMTNQHHLHRPNARETSFDCSIVTECAVAMQLAEVATNQRNVVGSVRSKRMTRDAHRLPRRESTVNLAQEGIARLPKLGEFISKVRRVRSCLERFDLLLDLVDRSFEIQLIQRAKPSSRH